MEITLIDIVKPNCNEKTCCIKCNKHCKINNCIVNGINCENCFYQPYNLENIELEKNIEINKQIIFINK